MTALELKRMPRAVHEAVRPVERPDTPCVAVCSTTFDDICRGCGRTYIEVAHWVSMTAEQKEAVWERITAQGYPRRNT
ncbi:hypothetical protein SAMN05216552_10568 [Pseudoduganella namucuonensis]|uniref:DUF1289 domain-containing protein n=2 Tax=Pseudoduganella namucuonensis TaxID=1035707 RepID=A0A1I7M4Z8_9BURK|nr:hypothetical protein SAMN05216552_10568 [Pseudoduganella namucuonensis]